jgi:hypothetical protein
MFKNTGSVQCSRCILLLTKYRSRQNIAVDKISTATKYQSWHNIVVNKKSLSKKYHCRQNIHSDKISTLTKYRWRQDIDVNKISKLKKYRHWQNILVNKISTSTKYQRCAAQGTSRFFELYSISLREGLGRSKPATNPWNKHNNNNCRDCHVSLEKS